MQDKMRTSTKTHYEMLVNKTAQTILTRMDETIRLEDLTKATNTSEKTLIRAFNTTLGMSPVKFIWELRLTVANSLIISTSKAQISKIRSLCGFSSSAHFSRAFTKFTGLSPREARRRGTYNEGRVLCDPLMDRSHPDHKEYRELFEELKEVAFKALVER